jgi:cysteinyl-tRNA synthetase
MQVFNSLSGKKEEFQPHGNEVTMYVCGINPYSDAHIGHAMSYIIFDVVRRYLEYRGYKVRHVENVTDVEDNIIATANRLGMPVKELTDKYTDRYLEDTDNLNILRPHHMPKATETIAEIIAMTQGLIEKGFAYAVGGNVYFRVRQVPDYGKLSKRSLEQMMAGARIEAGEEKEDPMDFVLWKESKPSEPAWESPWGKGRPGWHIECSAMSLCYLGEQIDIHGGGQDLVFPHHENEIAQSESFTGKKPFVKYWMHNGLLQMGTDKMSKSIGNLITIREALQKYSADAIRIYILHSHYRTPLTYDESMLEGTIVALRAFRDAKWRFTEDYSEMNRLKLEEQGMKIEDFLPAEEYRNRFITAMDDDFNTPKAVSTLFTLAQEINRAVNLGYQEKLIEHRELFIELSNVLGLVIPKPKEGQTISVPSISSGEVVPNPTIIRHNVVDSHIQRLVNERAKRRNDKNWDRADEIRKKLSTLGVLIKDTKSETKATYIIPPSEEALEKLMKEFGIE